MIIDCINTYRTINHKPKVLYWNRVENDFCYEHCLYMAKIAKLEHTPDYFLKDKDEAIAFCQYNTNFFTTIQYLIFNVLNQSEAHRNVLLNYNNLAYGYYIHNNETAYLTIRGWN